MGFVFSKKYEENIEKQLRDFYGTLSEKDRRRYAAIEAKKLGYGGIGYIGSLLGCSTKTIAAGIAELDSLSDDETSGRIRRVGGGRKNQTEIHPDLTQNFLSRQSAHRR